MSGFQSPNHTQVPNDLFDMMADMTGAELKVVLHAIRQTLGFHRGSDAISLTQFEKATGLTRQSVKDGINAAMKRGVIEEEARGKRGVVVYRLVYLLDQSENQTSTSLESRPVEAATSLKNRHTKERGVKETSQKKGESANKPAPLSVLVAQVNAHPLWQAFNRGYNSNAPLPDHKSASQHLSVLAALEGMGVNEQQVEAYTRSKVMNPRRKQPYKFTYLADDLKDQRAMQQARETKPKPTGVWARKSLPAPPADSMTPVDANAIREQVRNTRAQLLKKFHADTITDERAS